MHKDQQRIQDVFVPQLMDRIVTEGDPAAERDCTILNRLLIQGPDPLYLMETCPEEFGRLCSILDVDEAAGRQAIENAHWMGPGCLLEGTGLNPEGTGLDIPEAQRLEALWLILAGCSDCTEEGYSDDTSMLARIRKANNAVMGFAEWAIPDRELSDLIDGAADQAKKFIEETPWRDDPAFGVPLADGDHAFYVGYKLGHPCVAATSGELTFYGTIPGTTLAEYGVKVDKELSPSFGIVFPKG